MSSKMKKAINNRYKRQSVIDCSKGHKKIVKQCTIFIVDTLRANTLLLLLLLLTNVIAVFLGSYDRAS